MVNHCGLYFTEEHVRQAQGARDSEPYLSAYLFLHEREQRGIAAAQWYGLRYSFDDNADAGERAVEKLADCIDEPLSDDLPYLDGIAETLMLAQSFELTRDHPAWSAEAQTRWLNLFQDRVNQFSGSPYNDTQVENLWLAALALASGIVLERDDIVRVGVEVFQRTIDQEISPRGHMLKAVEGKDGGSLYRQILSASALVLMAEAASHYGIDLWSYNNRGVSVVTTAVYPIYYFYTPEKWRWDEGISVDETQLLFRRCGGYLEMLYRQTGYKDLKPLLEDLRPIYDPHGGGLTTLTHGIPLKPKRRGLFG